MGINQDLKNEGSLQLNKRRKGKKHLKVNLAKCSCSGSSESQQETVNAEPSLPECSTHSSKVSKAIETQPSQSIKSSKPKRAKQSTCLSSKEVPDSDKKFKVTQSKGNSSKKIKNNSSEVSLVDECSKLNASGVKKEKKSKCAKEKKKRDVDSSNLSDTPSQIVEKSTKSSKDFERGSLEHAPVNPHEQVESNEGKCNSNENTNEYERLSKSKRRKIRKKRIRAALGLTGTSHVKPEETQKKKKNKNLLNYKDPSSCHSVCTCDFSNNLIVNKGESPIPPILESEDQVDLSANLLRGGLDSPEIFGRKSEEVTSAKDIVDDKSFDEITSLSLGSYIDSSSFLNEEISSDLLSSSRDYCCGDLQDCTEVSYDKTPYQGNPSNYAKSSAESYINLPKREDNTLDKLSLPNFLSHDNVEGLFRSALLNDITLSSRCSEKEVKNFFNTYGTFSEKNRSQFAEVEKLLLSSNRVEDSSESLLFGNEKSVRESTASSSLEFFNSYLPVANQSPSTGIKDLIDSVVKTESENLLLSNSSVRSSSTSGLNTSEDAQVNKTVNWGPIYTSPNPETLVISSPSNTQIHKENRVTASQLPSTFSSTLIKPEKTESRLLEIVENVLLAHERVREQLTTEKKSQKECSNLPDSNSSISLENRSIVERTSGVNIISNFDFESFNHNRNIFEFNPRDSSSSVFPLDCPSVPLRTSPISKGTSSSLGSEDCREGHPSSLPGKCVTNRTEMQKIEKSKEEIRAEREAKKLAKLARKNKASSSQDYPIKDASAGDASIGKKNDNSKKSKDVSSVSDKGPLLPLTSVTKMVEVTKENEASQKPSPAVTPCSMLKENVNKPKVSTEESAKSKAELKAERRAKQEAQRAAKAFQQGQTNAKLVKENENKLPTSKLPATQPSSEVTSKLGKVSAAKETGKEVIKTAASHKVKLFNHLYVKQEATVPKSILATSNLHPAVVRLGVQYATKVIVGSNARCLALLSAVKQVIEDFKTPPQQEFSRGLEAILQPCMSFLQECRPISVSMTNAVKHLKWQMRKLPHNISDVDAKKKLQEAIDTYIREQIEVAGQAICNTVIEKISSGDVILTYGCSSLLQRILIKAHRNGTQFRVVIVDARPWREGKEMLRRLVESGLHCSYVVITAASFIMREATKVFLGAHALLANGYVMSRAGSSQIALLAHSYNVPVLVCCETHKFSERVQTDSIVYNELGAPDELVPTDLSFKEHPLSKWRTVNHLTPLNLTYDVTPPDLVTAVVTELAILPCTSVPVILRIKPTEIGC